LREALPAFTELSKDPALGNVFGANLLTTPIQEILRKVGANNPKYQALQTLTGQFLFDRIKEQSGAAFTETEYKARETLNPKASDTLPQAMAKVSAQVALNMTAAQTKIQGLKATDHDVGGVSELFSGINLPDVPREEAQSILNNLPKDLRNNREFMNQFVDLLPPGIRSGVDAQLLLEGKPRAGAVESKIKGALGVE
jgi:hypothetical protein